MKRPLKITGIAFLVGLAIVIIGGTWLFNQKIPGRKMEQRAQMMGKATATLICVVVAPFWLIAATRIRKDREAQAQDTDPKSHRKS